MKQFFLTLSVVCCTVSVVAAERPLMKDFIGINGHFTFKPELYRPVCSLVRNYHPVYWDLADDTATPPQFPVARQNNVNWQSLYGSWQKAGFKIDACLQIESVKREHWKNPAADGEAYGRAFAKYFGAAGLVESAEIGNEPASWSAAEYREIFTGMARGLRAGDARLKIVTAAVADGDGDKYAKNVSGLENLGDLYDVLSIHTYSMIEGWPTWRRVHPEHPHIAYLRNIEKLLAWRDRHAPGKEVWITEFGYDAGTGKRGSGDFAGWVSASEIEQAQWLARSLLVFAAMPVARAYVYYYDDKDEPMFHASSGITRNFEPKPAYHALAHLQRALGEYRFTRIVEHADGDLYVYEFASGSDPRQLVWAVWSPTGTQREVEKILTVSGRVTKAERMPLTAGEGVAAPFTVSGNKLTLTVSESPVYLWIER